MMPDTRMFRDLTWSPAEKNAARKAYDAALESALGKIVAEFKKRAAAAATAAEVWEIEDYLRVQRREIDDMFDFRYSRLPGVFALLIRAGHLEQGLLDGLSDDKREIIRSLVAGGSP
jgi:Photoprotection regulator fluorescence recovery protein